MTNRMIFSVMVGLILATGSAQAQTTTISGTAAGPGGTDDNWNNAINWDGGIPSNAMNAVVSNGVIAQVDNAATPTYSGTLTLNTGSELRVKSNGSENAMSGASMVYLGTNSLLCLKADTYPAPMTILGDINKIYATGDHQNMTFSGTISGNHALTLQGRNGVTFQFNGSNTFSGGMSTLYVSSGGHRVRANVKGALGVGDVTINNQCSLYMNASNTIGDAATLSLNGSRSTKDDVVKLGLYADNTIGAFVIDGVDQSYGIKNSYTHPGIISGSGSLMIAIPPGDDDDDLDPNATDPAPTDPTVYAGAPEIADGKDNDGNGIVDDGLGFLCTNTMAASGVYLLAANWSLGTMPSGGHNAFLAEGVAANVSLNPVFSYTGSLNLGTNASLALNSTEGGNALGTNIIMNSGSAISLGARKSFTFPAIVLTGDGEIRASSHNVGHDLDGVISGSGVLTFKGVNDNPFDINTSNTCTGGIAIYNGNSRIEANVDGALGGGDVVISNSASLSLAAGLSNTINDAASLFFYGPGAAKAPHQGKKIAMYSSETVSNFWVEGVQKIAGTWGASGSGCQYTNDALFLGSGVLTVLGDPPLVAPALDTSSIVDDAIMYTVYEDYTQVVYTLTFDMEMDLATFQTADFTNAGTAAINIGTITKDVVDGKVFYIEVGPTSAGTLRFGVAAGADLQTLVGGILDTTTAIIDNDTITILAGPQPRTTISGSVDGPGGSSDTWNNEANWNFGIPYASGGGVIDSNIAARASSTFRTFDGNLVLREGSSLGLYASCSFPSVYPGKALFYENTKVIENSGSSIVFDCPLELLGDLRVEAPAHHGGVRFNYSISGSGGITMYGANNTTFSFNATNTFTGDVLIYNGNSRIVVDSDGALGVGDVTISNACSLLIASSLSDTIDDDSALQLYGAKDSRSASKVVLGSDETVGIFRIEGLPQQKGTWGGPLSGADFETNLFSGAGILTVRWTEIPAAGTVLIVK